VPLGKNRGGVVDEPVQGGAGAPLFEPGKEARIQLHELPHGRGARPTTTVLGRAAATRGGPAERQSDPAHGRAAHGQRVELLQLLREVHIVEARIGRRHQPHDVRAQGGGTPPARGLAPAAMHQPAHALAPEAGLESLELPHAHTQRAGTLLVRDLAGQGGLDQPGPRHFLPAHREGLHEGRTFSRSS